MGNHVPPNVASPQLPPTEPEAANFDRTGAITLPAGMLVGPEVKAVIKALEHPPQKGDFFSTSVSCLGAAAVILKSVLEILKSIGDKEASIPILVNIAAIAVSASLAGIVVWRYVDQCRKRHPFHDLALSWVKSLPTEQEPAKKSGEEVV